MDPALQGLNVTRMPRIGTDRHIRKCLEHVAVFSLACHAVRHVGSDPRF